MLCLTNLVGFGAGGLTQRTLTYSFRGVTTDTSDVSASSYTFASADIGTANANRVVVVGVGHNDATSVDSVTIGGVSATRAGSQPASAGATASLWYLNVAAGTTANIVVTLSVGTANRCVIAVWAVVPDILSPNDTASGTAINTSGANANDLDVRAGGLVLAMAYNSNTSGLTPTWNGTDSITTDASATIEAANQYGAYSFLTTVSTSTNDLNVAPGTNSVTALAAVSFR